MLADPSSSIFLISIYSSLDLFVLHVQDTRISMMENAINSVLKIRMPQVKMYVLIVEKDITGMELPVLSYVLVVRY